MNQIYTYPFSARSVRALVLGLMLSTVFSVFGQNNVPAPYTTAGTFTWTPTFSGTVKVECWGGGGGGAGVPAVGTGTNYRAGGGGGGGSYAIRNIVNVVSGTAYTVTVGAGGAAGSGASTISAAYGGPGGASSFSGGAVTTTTASGGTGGGAGAPTQPFGTGGVLGGVYGYIVGGTSTGPYTQGATITGGGGTGASARVGISNAANAAVGPNTITFLAPNSMGSGYTSAPTVTASGAGSGQTFAALFNPNVNAGDAVLAGTTGGAGAIVTSPAPAVTAAAVSVSTNSVIPNSPMAGQTTLTITANTSIISTSLIWGAQLSIPAAGASVVSNSGTTLVINAVLPTPTAGTKTVYAHNADVTSGAGGAGASPGGGAGAAAVTNSLANPFRNGTTATALSGGGSGGISSNANSANGGAGAAGQVIITFLTLGVELAQFDAKANQKSTSLTWTTASEKDNAHFNIEQSTNGKDFQKVGQVKGHGTTSGSNSYTYEHSNPSVGVNYYRLKQEDFDGTASYSPIKSVTFGYGKTSLVVKNTLSKDEIIVVVGEEAATTVNIVNIAGQQVFTAKAQGEQRLNVSALPAGVYIISTANAIARFVKQ
jgi:Secretion system C-terminal sorting domain